MKVAAEPDDRWTKSREDRRRLLQKWNRVASVSTGRTWVNNDGEDDGRERWTLTGCYLQAPPKSPAPVLDAGGGAMLPLLDHEMIPLQEVDLVERRTWVSIGHASAHRPEWPWDLDAERKRIASCETSVAVAWTGGDGSDAWQPVVLRCGSRLCPVCWQARAGRAVHRWGPVLEAALADGASCWAATFSQRSEAVHGSALLPHERKRWDGIEVGTDHEAQAVAGESAYGAYTRWISTWRDLMQSRSVRDQEVGLLRGVEFTLRQGGRNAPRVQLPRWHCHGHVLIVSREVGWTPQHLLETWATLAGVRQPRTRHGVTPTRKRRAGGSYGGQQFVQHGGQWAERISDRSGLLEVLKYPFKPGELTVAASVDAWAALRGAKTHFPGRALHSSSNAAKRAPWSSWLACRAGERGWGILEWAWPEACGTAAELAAFEARGEKVLNVNGWHPVTARSSFPRDRAVRLRVPDRTEEDDDDTDATAPAPRRWHVWLEDDPWRYAAVGKAHPVGSAEPVEP